MINVLQPAPQAIPSLASRVVNRGPAGTSEVLNIMKFEHINKKLDLLLRSFNVGEPISDLSQINQLRQKAGTREEKWLNSLESVPKHFFVLELDAKRFLFVEMGDGNVYSFGETKEGRKEIARRLRSKIGLLNYVTPENEFYWMLVGAYSRLDPAWDLKYIPGIDYVMIVHENRNKPTSDAKSNLGVYLGNVLDLPSDHVLRDCQGPEFSNENIWFNKWFEEAGLPNAKAIFMIGKQAYWCRRLAANKSENLITVLSKTVRELVQDQTTLAMRISGFSGTGYAVHHPVPIKWMVDKFCADHDIEKEIQFSGLENLFSNFHKEICQKTPLRVLTTQEHKKCHVEMEIERHRLGREMNLDDYIRFDLEYFGRA